MKLSIALNLALAAAEVFAHGHGHGHHNHPHGVRSVSSKERRLIGITIGLPTLPGVKTTTTTKKTTTTTTKKTTTTTTTTKKTTTTTTKSTTTTKAATTTKASTTKTSTTKTSSATLLPTSILDTNVIIDSTILIIGKDQASVKQAANGFNGYGIPYQTLLVPQDGVTLPALNSSSGGNFGGFVVFGGVSYDYGGTIGWRSALTDDQWNQLYSYQTLFGIRMVQLDVYPQGAFGVSATGSCCDTGVDQQIYFTNTTGFPGAGLKTGSSAGVGTSGLYHYLGQVTDSSTTWEIAQFGANSVSSSPSTAAVINDFAGRQQMAFFIGWATDWSPTSAFLQHAYITWMTRGIYTGYRRVNLQTQIDDLMLRTGIYYPGASTSFYRINTDDMKIIQDWYPQIESKMNPGSYYRVELGHNGNGNIIWANDSAACSGGPIYTTYSTTTLEYQKPLGSGSDGWPVNATTYPYTSTCLNKDALAVWMFANRDSFMHISHTFSHEGQNNATYNDINKEISWNQQWFKQTGISDNDNMFSPDGIIPPAITGLHNGDALKAWADNGITNCVGDNSRPLLRNQNNPMWPYITNVNDNGYDGVTVIPRWSTRIYYDCDTPVCTTQEWIDKSGGSGDFTALMAAEKSDTSRYLLGLYHDGYMFHQLNLRSQDMSTMTTPYGTQVRSLLQAWVEQTVYEFTRLVDWPMITLKQTDLAQSFRDRMARDACKPNLKYIVKSGKITGVTVSASSGSCSAAIPVTIPGSLTSTLGFDTEKLGNDPLTVWVKLSGQPVDLSLASALKIL